MAGDPSVDYFMGAVGNSSNGRLFGSQPEPTVQSPFGNLFGNSPIMGMIAPFATQMLHSHLGTLPAQFAPTQNVYDQYRARQYQMQHMEAVQRAADADKSTYVNMMRGIAQMSGTPFGLQQQVAANTIAGDVANLVPFLAPMMPDTIDALHGPQGSAAVAAMAVHRGGRYAIDPATGRIGLSAASAGAMAGGIREQLYGDRAQIESMRGLGSGRVGQLYEELQSRGAMGTTIGGFDRGDQIRLMTQSSKDTVESLEKLDSPAFETKLRQFDAKKTAERLKGLVGAVSAMRDIFGDMGRPDAPMSELISGLTALTQNGLSSRDPKAIEQDVRKTYALAKQTGVGINGMMGLMTQTSEFASSQGLSREFGVEAARGAAAFGAAYGQVGGADRYAYGRMDREKYTLMDAKLRVQAASSDQANQLNALLRYSDTVGGLNGKAGEIAEALRSGRTTLADGTSVTEFASRTGDFQRLLSDSGVSGSVAAGFLRNRSANDEYGLRYNTGNMIRTEGQGRELRERIQQHYGDAAVVAGRNVDTTSARRIGELASSTLLNMSAETYTDERARTSAIIDAVSRDPQLNGKFTMQELRQFAAIGYGNFDQATRTGDLKGYGSGVAALDLHNKRVHTQAEQQQREAATKAQMGSALAGLGQIGPLGRLAGMLQNPPGSLSDALGEVIGGVPKEEIQSRLNGIAALDPEKLKALPDADKQLALMESLALGSSKQDSGAVEALISGGDSAKVKAASIRDAATKAGRELTKDEQKMVKALDMAESGGLVKLSHKMGQTVGVKINPDVLNEVGAHGKAADQLIASNNAGAIKQNRAGLTKGQRVVDALLGDTDSLKRMGHMSFETLREAQESYEKMDADALAYGGGRTVEEILASQDPNDELAATFKYNRDKIAKDLGGLTESLRDGGAKPMTDDEMKRMKEFQASRSDPKKINRKVIDDLLKAKGISLKEEDAESLTGLLGDPIKNQSVLNKLRAATGVIKTGADKATDAGGDHARMLTGDLDRIGEVGKGTGEGTGKDVIAGALKDFVQSAKSQEGQRNAASPTKITISGKLDVNTGELTGTGNMTGHGSTPVA